MAERVVNVEYGRRLFDNEVRLAEEELVYVEAQVERERAAGASDARLALLSRRVEAARSTLESMRATAAKYSAEES